jgi:hypothetical protein
MLPAGLRWLPPRNAVPPRNGVPRSGDDRLRGAVRPDSDGRPDSEPRWFSPGEEEWLKTEPPSSDRPMLELLNTDVLRAELAGLATPSLEPPTTPS